MESPAPSALAEVERALVRIRRSMGKRTLGRLMARDLGAPVDLALLGVLDAVDEGPQTPGEEVTVGVVAERLAIDPSRASRVVAQAIQAGYLTRVASQADGRRIRLELTAAGAEAVRAVRDARQAFFARLMRGWPERDREEFARLLTAFTEALASAGEAETPAP